jgi:hypothetical protein
VCVFGTTVCVCVGRGVDRGVARRRPALSMARLAARLAPAWLRWVPPALGVARVGCRGVVDEPDGQRAVGCAMPARVGGRRRRRDLRHRRHRHRRHPLPGRVGQHRRRCGPDTVGGKVGTPRGYYTYSRVLRRGHSGWVLAGYCVDVLRGHSRGTQRVLNGCSRGTLPVLYRYSTGTLPVLYRYSTGTRAVLERYSALRGRFGGTAVLIAPPAAPGGHACAVAFGAIGWCRARRPQGSHGDAARVTRNGLRDLGTRA